MAANHASPPPNTSLEWTGWHTFTLLVINLQPEAAQWADMFRGEETGNAAHLDLSKIQMFYFTVILVLAYTVALGRVFCGSEPDISMFPAVDPSMVALLGISHAGYLTHKTISHSAAA